MSVAILDEIVEKTAQLTDKERRELIKLLQVEESKINQNSKLNSSPNIEWLKTHQHEYAGNYVALKDGELVAVGKTIKEADLKAKEKGFDKTLLHYIPAQSEEVWGGW
jgi:Family of unknown function (DUF5678)